MTTCDPEEGRAALQQDYRGLRLPQPAAGFEMSLARTAYGPLTAQRLRLIGWDSNGANDNTGLLRIGCVTHGRFLVRWDRVEITGGPVFLFPTGGYEARWESLGLSILTVQSAVVEDYARALTGRTGFRLEFTGHHPRTQAHAKYWRATSGHVVDHVLVNQVAAASPLLLEQSLRSLAVAVLSTFPNSFLAAGADPEPLGRPRRRPCAGRSPSSRTTWPSPSACPRSPPRPG